MGFPPNPGPLPLLRLCNRNPPYNPVKGEGILGHKDLPVRSGIIPNPSKELVKHLQMMLRDLGYDLGKWGPNKDGVDGVFGDAVENAVKSFQSDQTNTDWEGKSLEVDGKVGPNTAYALNQAMIGIWYYPNDIPVRIIQTSIPDIIEGKHKQSLKKSVKIPCPGKENDPNSGVILAQGPGAIFGIGHPHNVGSCSLSINSFDENDNMLREEDLNLDPGESKEWYHPPKGTVKIVAVCFTNCSGEGKLEMDMHIA